LLSYKSCIFSF